MKILLIAGGWSSKREVSLAGAKGMESALKGLGHEVRFCDLLTDFDRLIALAEEHDFAMLNLHGTPGEDGLVQAMTGSPGSPTPSSSRPTSAAPPCISAARGTGPSSTPLSATSSTTTTRSSSSPSSRAGR